MTTLQQALAAIPYHLIAIIGRQHHLSFSAKLPKSTLIDLVASTLLNSNKLPEALAQLSPPETQCLMDVLAAGARLPVRYLADRNARSLAPRRLIRAHRQQAQLTPVERLCLRGLLFYDQATYDLFIPTDLMPLLPQPNRPVPPVVTTPTAFSPIDLLCHDLTCLLALLQRDQVSLLHGRWLPPHFLQLWGQHCAGPPDHPNARSELQTNRRRFLHYLAESAGFVTGPEALVTGQAKRKRPFYTGRVETYTGRVETERETMNNETMNNETMNNETMNNETVNNETMNNETVNNETMKQ